MGVQAINNESGLDVFFTYRLGSVLLNASLKATKMAKVILFFTVGEGLAIRMEIFRDSYLCEFRCDKHSKRGTLPEHHGATGKESTDRTVHLAVFVPEPAQGTIDELRKPFRKI